MSNSLSSKLSFKPPIIAHRGASSHAPENTLAAFRKAKELGLSWVEFDVMLSSDGEGIVIHDEFLDRTTNGRGRVGDFLYNYLRTLDAGSWFDPSFSDEKIPTLREVLSLLNELHLSANIEIKAQLGKEEETVQKVLKIINEAPLSQLFISSFSIKILEIVRAHDATLNVGFLMDKWKKSWEKICDELKATAVDVNYKILTPEKVAMIKKTNRVVLAYTVNDPSIAKKLLSWGVDAIFSDCPSPMLS